MGAIASDIAPRASRASKRFARALTACRTALVEGSEPCEGALLELRGVDDGVLSPEEPFLGLRGEDDEADDFLLGVDLVFGIV